MFDNDLLIAFTLMALLFLRQIAILKQPNKINYAPLMLSIGAISAVVHFILHPQSDDIVLLSRESFIPLLLALILYVIMNILHQMQISLHARDQELFTHSLAKELSQLKEFILELEKRMSASQYETISVQKELREDFIHDLEALNKVLKNQSKFIEKFEIMEGNNKEIQSAFKYFSEVQLPELDNVVHKHIDLLRIAEQEHYNKLTTLLQKAVEGRYDISEDIEKLELKLNSMQLIADEIAQNITTKTVERLSGVTKAFEGELSLLKSHTEGLKTSLYEGESTLSSIKTQSEMIMKQMLLSSKKMDELEGQNSRLYDWFETMKILIAEVQTIKADYVKAQSQLSKLTQELTLSKDEKFVEMQNKIDDVSQALSKKIDESIEKLHEHYHITNEDITQQVQVLAKKAQLKKGYTDLDD
ncbi:hypothetical protein [Sulfurimonas sp.]